MNPFLRQPLALQRTPLRAERPEPKTGEAGVVSLRLYDPLDSWGGPWGVSAKEFTAALDELPEDTAEIRLLISSPGGEVWEGLAILNALRAHPAKVVAVVEGIAASSASFIAAGVDELAVMANAELFVHNAWGLCVGNAADMDRMRRDLTHEDRNIASIYAAKTGGTVDEWLVEMGEERWYSAQDAVDAGLADRVIEPAGDRSGAARAKARFDLSALSHADRKTPAASVAGNRQQEGVRVVAFTPEQLTSMRRDLGLADTADETTITTALTEALAERADTGTADLGPGVVPIQQSVLTEMQANLARLSAESDDRATQQREAIVDTAIREGKSTPAERDAWIAAIEANPAAAATLQALPNRVPVDKARGHASIEQGGGGQQDDDDPSKRMAKGRDLYAARHGKTA